MLRDLFLAKYRLQGILGIIAGLGIAHDPGPVLSGRGLGAHESGRLSVGDFEGVRDSGDHARSTERIEGFRNTFALFDVTEGNVIDAGVRESRADGGCEGLIGDGRNRDGLEHAFAGQDAGEESGTDTDRDGNGLTGSHNRLLVVCFAHPLTSASYASRTVRE